MKISKFAANLWSHVQAGSPCLLIESSETERVDQAISELSRAKRLTVLEWNLGYGWVDHLTQLPRESVKQLGLAEALAGLVDEDISNTLIVIKQASLALNNCDIALARVQLLAERIIRHHRGDTAVLLADGTGNIPGCLEPFTTHISLPLPQNGEVTALVQRLCGEFSLEFDHDQLPRAANGCAGLSHQQIRQVLSLASQQFSELSGDAIQLILREKERIISGSGVLEMVPVQESASDIGGLEELKEWLESRAAIIHRLHEARQFGIAPPKGVLIAGMPGCGKSLTAKVAASLFQLPLLRLDIGSMLGKYVGESEHNMRKALNMAETVSPCILWVDELEKAFVGMGSNNASEVTSRLLGYFLTWMQEKTDAVFVIATANDITALPPELMRKGRFDETFYVGFPNSDEREAILEIHLQRANQPSDQFDLAALASLCRDYSGADIQNAVNLALESAFLAGDSLSQSHLEKGFSETVPLRETLREQVAKYEDLFEKLKLRPASRYSGLTLSQMIAYASGGNQVRREQVARDPDCPDDLLEKLSQDEEPSVCEAVLRHSRCPESILTEQINAYYRGAANAKRSQFELAVIHPNAPEDLMVRAVEDGLDMAHLSKQTLRFLSVLPGLENDTVNRINKLLNPDEPHSLAFGAVLAAVAANVNKASST